MTNIHIHEIELEKLARSLAEGATDEIFSNNEHLQTCDVCRQKLVFFVKYYTFLDEELAKTPEARVRHFAEKLISPNIIYFKPYTAQPDLESIGIGKNSYVLAAQTVADEVVRYKTTATFASEDVHALVKINEDTEQKLYHLFVLSENEAHRSYVLIGIAEADGEKFFIPTNKDGFAELPYSNPINWSKATLILNTPNEVISFDKVEKKSGDITSGFFKYNFKTEEHLLTFNFLPDSRTLPHHILLIYEDSSQIYKMIDETAISFAVDSDKKINEIRLF